MLRVAGSLRPWPGRGRAGDGFRAREIAHQRHGSCPRALSAFLGVACVWLGAALLAGSPSEAGGARGLSLETLRSSGFPLCFGSLYVTNERRQTAGNCFVDLPRARDVPVDLRAPVSARPGCPRGPQRASAPSINGRPGQGLAGGSAVLVGGPIGRRGRGRRRGAADAVRASARCAARLQQPGQTAPVGVAAQTASPCRTPWPSRAPAQQRA